MTRHKEIFEIVEKRNRKKKGENRNFVQEKRRARHWTPFKYGMKVYGELAGGGEKERGGKENGTLRPGIIIISTEVAWRASRKRSDRLEDEKLE